MPRSDGRSCAKSSIDRCLQSSTPISCFISLDFYITVGFTCMLRSGYISSTTLCALSRMWGATGRCGHEEVKSVQHFLSWS